MAYMVFLLFLEHQDVTRTPKRKPVACKTVADLIALMKESPSTTCTEALTCDHHVPHKTTPDSRFYRGTSAGGVDHNEKLRLLLENYEVFVPHKDDRDGNVGNQENENNNDQTKALIEPKRPISEDPSLSLHKMDEYDKESRLTRSKSAQNSTPKRVRIATGSKSEIKVRLHSQKEPKRTTNSRQESFSPTVRQIVTEYGKLGNKPPEFLCNSPSKRFEKQDFKSAFNTLPSYKGIIDTESNKTYERDIRRRPNSEADLPQCERARSSKRRVSFASIIDRQYSYINDSTQNQPCKEIDGSKMNESKEELDGMTEDDSSSIKTDSRHVKFDQEKTIHRIEKGESPTKTQELPLKVFSPYFPVDYKKLRHLLHKHSNKHVTNSQRISPSISSHYSDYSVIDELDYMYTGVKPGSLVNEMKHQDDTDTKPVLLEAERDPIRLRSANGTLEVRRKSKQSVSSPVYSVSDEMYYEYTGLKPGRFIETKPEKLEADRDPTRLRSANGTLVVLGKRICKEDDLKVTI